MTVLKRSVLQEIYRRLFLKFGPQSWWPARTSFEVMVGAILTQNTNWTNVERALVNLKKEHLLTPQGLHKLSHAQLASLIKPAGYFNIKARRLKNFLEFFYAEYAGDLRRMAAEEMETLRRKLLQVNGIGPETADSILLYAFNKPVFVIDAYTKRFLSRHNLVSPDARYHEIQKLFTGHLKSDARLFNEYHALIVRLGKDLCRSQPRCDICPLNDFHYSLTFKCGLCHRALPKKEERFFMKKLSVGVPRLLVCSFCKDSQPPAGVSSASNLRSLRFMQRFPPPCGGKFGF